MMEPNPYQSPRRVAEPTLVKNRFRIRWPRQQQTVVALVLAILIIPLTMVVLSVVIPFSLFG